MRCSIEVELWKGRTGASGWPEALGVPVSSLPKDRPVDKLFGTDRTASSYMALA